MIKCPKCGAEAQDGTQNCPICFATMTAAPPVQNAAPAPPSPLGAAPPPASPAMGVPFNDNETLVAGIPGIDNVPKDVPLAYSQAPSPMAPPMGLAGGTRTTLSGEVIPDSLPQSPYGQPIAGPPSGPTTMRPVPPSPGPPGRQGSTRIRAASGESKGSGGIPVAIVVVILLLLAGGGAFGYWYWQKQQAPARTVDQFMSAFQKKDWKTVYNLMEIPTEQKGQLTEQMFTGVMAMVGNMVTLKSYKIGAVENKGDTATVKVTATASTPAIMGQPAGEKTGTNEVPLRLVDGKWKLDLSKARGVPGMGGIGGMVGP